MANQNFRVKKGLEVGLGATFLYADDTGVGINSTQPRANLDVRGTADILNADLTNLQAGVSTFVGVSTFKDDVFVDTHLYGDIVSQQIESANINVSGITTSENLRVVDTANFDKELYGNHVAVAGTFAASGVSSFTGELQYGIAVGSSIFGETVAFSTATGDFASVTELSANKGIFNEITFGDATIDPDGNTGISSEFITTKDLYITGIATFTTGVTTQLNAENIDAGITTTTDLYIENLLYDSNSQIGVGNSVLITEGGKLVWTTPDLAGIATFFRPGSTFYVSENGTDSLENDGLSPEKAWASLTYALSQVSAGTNDIIQLTAGTYTETFPLTVPDGITIRGAGQRATTIQPNLASRGADGFQLGDACTVEDITVSGMLKDGAENYAFVFRSGATITTRSPYISNVTIINKGSSTTSDDPYGFGSADSPPSTFRSANGVMVDGALLNSASLEAAFLLNEVTMFVPAATGIHLKNGARSEQINCFIYFAERGIHAETDLTTGLYGAGRTRLKLDSPSSAPAPGDTVEYYDADGTTVLASGVVDTFDGTYTYLQDSGTGQFVVPRNRNAKVVNFVDTAQLSTAQAKFGTASLDLTGGNTDGITVDNNSDFGFGTGDFTLEFWIYKTGSLNNNVLLDLRSTATESAVSIHGTTGDALQVLIGNSAVITGSTGIAGSGWSHIAVTRAGTDLKLFINGIQDGSTYTSTDDLGTSRELHFGDDYNSSNSADAYYDELRITKGAAKYTGTFTPSAVALKSDKDTSILLHFDGINGATETSDDIVTVQDIRFAGNTANATTLADYSQFGADVRNVGSAVEYGKQGVVGEGQGVKLRLVSINFNHVGALGDISNDFNTATKAQEVVNVDGKAQIAYVSIDELGNFRVGDEFSVNQETGEVSFTNTTTDLTSLNSLTITDGTNNSIITPTSGRFGDVLVSGNNVETVSGDLNLLAAGGGDINIIGDTNVIGVLTAQVINIDAIQKGDTSIALDDADSQTGGVIRFNTDNAEAMRIDDNQNVGINSTAPRSVLDVRGELNTTDLVVSGFSTFTGVATFAGGVEVTGDLSIEGDLSVDELAARNLSVSGFSTFSDISFAAGVATSLQAGFASIGVATVTTAGITSALVSTANIGVATVGLASVTDLQFTTGVGYTMTVDTVVGKKGYFEEIAFGDVDVAPDGNTGISSEFITTKDLYITGIATFTTGVTTQLNAENIDAGISTIGYANISNGVVGVATITEANIATAYVGHTSTTTLRSGVTTTGLLSVEGNAAVSGLVDVTGGIKVGAALTAESTLEVTGATTLADTLTVAKHSELSSTLNVSGMTTIMGGMDVSGISSFQDPVSFASSVSIEGNLFPTGDIELEGDLVVGSASSITANSIYISGVTSTSLLQATSAVIGLVEDDLNVEANISAGTSITAPSVYAGLTSTTNLEVQSAKIAEVTTDVAFTQNIGVASSITSASVYTGLTSTTALQASEVGIGSMHFEVGFGTDLTVANLNVDAITAEDLGAQDLVVSRNVIVSGLSTFTGISTFGSDVFVEGNLNVKGDITLDDATLDEATIVDLTVTGFTTTANLNFTSGVGTHLELNTLNVGVSTLGVVTATSIRTTGSVAIGDTLFVANGVVVGGGITFQGDVEVNVDANFQGNINVGGIATVANLDVYSGTVGTLGVTTSLSVGAALTTSEVLDVRGVAGFATDVAIDGNLQVDGTTTLNGQVTLTDTLTATEATTVDSTLRVTGISTFENAIDIQGNAQLSELDVVGVATFTGIGTFKDDVFVDGNLYVTGDLVIDDVEQDQITGNNLNLNAGGIGTIPVLDYGTATGGIVSATQVITPNAQVVYSQSDFSNIGVATIATLDVNSIGISTASLGFASVTELTASNLTATAATIETATIEVGYADSITVTEELNSAYSVLTDANIGVATVGVATILDAFATTFESPSAVIYQAEITVGNIDDILAERITTVDLSSQDASFVRSSGNALTVGILTATDVDITNLTVGVATATVASASTLTASELNFTSGVGTHLELSSLNVGLATVGLASLTQANIGVATVGFMTVTQNTLMIGDLTVLGTANVGAGGSGTLIINGGGQITGIVTIGDNSITLDGRKDVENIIIGAGATISGATTDSSRPYIQIADGLFDQINAAGVGTFNSLDITTDVSVGSDVSIGGTVSIGATAYVTGDILTTGGIGAAGTVYSTLDVAADRNLTAAGDAFVVGNAALGSIRVSGASTFTGISTFGDDVFVEGNLRVKGDITVDDITYDTVSGNQLNISGVGTIGVVSFTTANGSVLGVSTLVAEELTVGNFDIVYGQAQYVNVTGFATHTDYSFRVGTGQTLTVNELIQAGDIDAPTGIATVNQVDAQIVDSQQVTTDTIFSADYAQLNDTRVGGALTVASTANVLGVTTFASNVTFEQPVELTNSADVTGTLDVAGFTTTTTLHVGVAATIKELEVSDDALVKGNLTVEGTVSFEGGSGGGGGGQGDTVVGIDSITTRFLNVTGIATLSESNLGVSTIGLASVTTLQATTADVFTATIDTATVETASIQSLTVPEGGFVSLPGIPVSGGIATFSQLRVTGVSTFVGVSTFSGDVYINDNLFVGGDQVFDSAQAIDLRVSGVITASNADVTGVGTIATVDIAAGEADLQFLTAGVATITTLNFTNAIGIQTIRATEGIFENIIFNNSESGGGGISTEGGTGISSEFITTKELYVTGITSTTTLDVLGSATVASNVAIGGSLTLLPAPTGVGGVYFDNSVVGVGTLLVQDGASVNGNLGVGKSLGVTENAYIDGDIIGFGGTISGYNEIQVPTLLANQVSTINLSATGVSTFAGDVLVVGAGAGTTDYSTVTVSGLSPSSFNQTYVRQSTGFVLDTNTVSSGGAEFHADSNYYYYVASTGTDPNSRMLIWSVADNAWMTVFDFNGTNFSEGNVSDNQALGFSGIFDDTVTSSTIVADGRNLPQASTDIVYSSTSGVSVGARISTSGDAEFVGFVTTNNFYVGTAATITDLTVGQLNQTGGGSLQLDDVTVGFITATNAYVSGMMTVQDLNSLSDRRVKENIRNVENPLEKVDKLNGVHFDFINSGRKSMGVIAQEVEQVFPELISGTFPKSVNYNGLIGVLIESVKELKAQNESMQKEIEELKKSK